MLDKIRESLQTSEEIVEITDKSGQTQKRIKTARPKLVLRGRSRPEKSDPEKMYQRRLEEIYTRKEQKQTTKFSELMREISQRINSLQYSSYVSKPEEKQFFRAVFLAARNHLLTWISTLDKVDKLDTEKHPIDIDELSAEGQRVIELCEQYKIPWNDQNSAMDKPKVSSPESSKKPLTFLKNVLTYLGAQKWKELLTDPSYACLHVVPMIFVDAVFADPTYPEQYLRNKVKLAEKLRTQYKEFHDQYPSIFYQMVANYNRKDFVLRKYLERYETMKKETHPQRSENAW